MITKLPAKHTLTPVEAAFFAQPAAPVPIWTNGKVFVCLPALSLTTLLVSDTVSASCSVADDNLLGFQFESGTKERLEHCSLETIVFEPHLPHRRPSRSDLRPEEIIDVLDAILAAAHLLKKKLPVESVLSEPGPIVPRGFDNKL